MEVNKEQEALRKEVLAKAEEQKSAKRKAS